MNHIEYASSCSVVSTKCVNYTKSNKTFTWLKVRGVIPYDSRLSQTPSVKGTEVTQSQSGAYRFTNSQTNLTGIAKRYSCQAPLSHVWVYFGRLLEEHLD